MCFFGNAPSFTVFLTCLTASIGMTLAAKQPTLGQQQDKAQASPQFEKIFDGKTLKGWTGDESIWSIKDGAITGTTTKDKPLKKNTFLIFEGKPVADFELKLKFKITGPRANSGIQFRSKHLGDFVVAGYQADIDITGTYIGILYEERGRGILARRGQKVVRNKDGKSETKGKTLDEDAFKKKVDLSDWNEYVIVARGNHIVQKINGMTTVDFVDEQTAKAAKQGILALQCHVGPPMTIQFKDIELKRID